MHSSCAHFLSALGTKFSASNEQFKWVSVGISTCHQMECDLSMNEPFRCVKRKWPARIHRQMATKRVCKWCGNYIQCVCLFPFNQMKWTMMSCVRLTKQFQCWSSLVQQTFFIQQILSLQGIFWALSCNYMMYENIKLPHIKGEPFTGNSSYVPMYTNYMPTEFLINGIVSGLLTVVNVICIFTTAIVVLKIKEVAAPYTSSPDLRR